MKLFKQILWQKIPSRVLKKTEKKEKRVNSFKILSDNMIEAYIVSRLAETYAFHGPPG
jgi:ribosomal protein RSM22 (predicted rRNA methylase)